MDVFDRVKDGDIDYIKTVTADVLLDARDVYGKSVLYTAAKEYQFDCCRAILKKCPSLLYQDTKYNVLHYAADSYHYKIIDYFLSVGLEAATNEGNIESREENMLRFKNWIKLKTESGDTALTLATYCRNLHIVKRLIEVDREYNLGLSKIVGWNKKTALQLAVDYEDDEMIKLLTDEGHPYSGYIPYSIAMDLFDHVQNGDVDFVKTVTEEVLLNSRDENRNSVLYIATRYNQLDCCKEILKRCPSLLYHRNNSKDTVLHFASDCGDGIYRLLDLFLSVGFHETTNESSIESNGETTFNFKKWWITLQNKRTHTALTLAAYNGHLHIVKRFIEVDRKYKLGLSRLSVYKGMTALEYAVEDQDHEMIKLLTDEGDPYSDYIPYSIAMDLFDHVKKGDLDYVKTVRSDVLLNSRDEQRRSALCIATIHKQLGCCEEILKRCPILLYHQNKYKYTVLHHAFWDGIYRLVDLFVGVGLDAATIEGNAKIKAENMQRFKNWINLQNQSKETALVIAVRKHNHDIVKRLLEVDRQYKLGLSEITAGYDKKTPLQLALEYEDQEMIKLLTEETDLDLEHGANTNSNMSILIATTQAKEALHTGNNSDSAGTNPDFDYGANTDGNMSLSIAMGQAQEALHTGNNINSTVVEGTDADFEYSANTDDNMSLMVATTQAQEALHTGNNSNSAGTDPDLEYGANTRGHISLSIATSQAQEALHTGNNGDSAGKDATDDFDKVRHTSLATDRMEDFYVGEFNKIPSTASVTKLLSDLAREKPQPYSHAQLMKFTKEFSDPVGSGGFGDVYKGEFPNGVLVAVKVLKNSRPELVEKQFVAEVSTMGRTYHRNLIKLYGYCYEADTKALIYEYMEKGDLDVILKKNNLDMVKLYTIATEIARGISYLHESCYPQIIHHDLKPANVLLDSKFSPRVIDFGLARLNMEKSEFAQSRLRGTYGYVAPEIALRGSGTISCKCDVYSFGMMLFDILKSKINYLDQRWLPGQVWEKVKEDQLDNFLKDHVIKEYDNTHAKTLSTVALLCAEYKPQNRPSMSTVVKMLEGGMTPNPPIDPFPLYDSSSDCSTTYDSSY